MRIQATVTFVILSFFLFFPTSSNAATITKVKGKKVMVSTEGDEMSSGEKFFAVDANGKRKAIVKITKVKGEKALGEVVKGKAVPNMALVKGKSKSERSASRSSSDGSLAVGGMLGYGIDSMTVTTDVGDVDMSGSGFGFDVVADYKLFSSFYLRGHVGYETFKTNSGVKNFGAAGTFAPEVSINFIKTGLMGQYAFLDTATQIWVGLGFDFYSASSSKANVLESVGGSGAVVVASGVNIPMGSFFIPIQGEYDMFMGQDDAKIGIFALRAGMMFKF